MNKELSEAIYKIDGLNLIDTEVGFGLSTLKLVYSHSDYVESEVKLFFNHIIYLRYFGRKRDNDGSLFIGQSNLLDISEFLRKSKDSEVNKHIEKKIAEGNSLNYFSIEGEVYIDVICQSIEVV